MKNSSKVSQKKVCIKNMLSQFLPMSLRSLTIQPRPPQSLLKKRSQKNPKRKRRSEYIPPRIHLIRLKISKITEKIFAGTFLDMPSNLCLPMKFVRIIWGRSFSLDPCSISLYSTTIRISSKLLDLEYWKITFYMCVKIQMKKELGKLTSENTWNGSYSVELLYLSFREK